MSTVRKFKYWVLLEWSGTVEVYVEDDDTEDDVNEGALDMAIDDALSSPAGFSTYDHTLEEVAEGV